MSSRVRISVAAALGLLMVMAVAGPSRAAEYLNGRVWPEPKVIDPGPPGGPPSDAIVLFDGKDLSQWVNGEKWIIKDGCATSNGDTISTKQPFGSCQIHVEWASPEKVTGSGQGRGNSGVYLMGHYEVQILDSYENTTYYDGQCGALYKQWPPLVNACRKPGEWQTYDIIFTAPKFDKSGKVEKPAYATVLLNGVLLQNHSELMGTTAWHKPAEYEPHAEKLPLSLQFHGNPVKFRNIWIRELNPEPRAPLRIDPNPKAIH